MKKFIQDAYRMTNPNPRFTFILPLYKDLFLQDTSFRGTLKFNLFSAFEGNCQVNIYERSNVNTMQFRWNQ